MQYPLQNELTYATQNQNFNSINNRSISPVMQTTNNEISSYTYSSKKARKQQWLSHIKQNKMLKSEMLLKGFDLRKESRPFLLTLKGVSGIPVKDILGPGENQMQGCKFTLEYYITLFNKDIGTHGAFYGRTFRSQPMILRESSGTWDSQQEEYMWFHTSYTEKSSIALIECVIIKEFAVTKTYLSAGFALCNIFDFAGLTDVELIKGSPRSIGQLGLEVATKGKKSPGKLSFEIRDFPTFDTIIQLIPQNCFCGSQDIIPGLVNDKLPHPRGGQSGNLGKIKLSLLPKSTVYIHNIKMAISNAFESRFESFLRKMKSEKLRTARGHYNEQETNNVYIAERRVIVCANNTWKNICEETYVSMSPPNEQGISTSGGSLTLKNFICHPLVSVVFRIEYKAMLPTDSVNEQAQFTLGWTYTIPSFNAMGGLSDEIFESDFDLGPGTAPTGDLLWDPNAEDINHFQIRLRALVSTNSQAPVDYTDPNSLKGSRRMNQSIPSALPPIDYAKLSPEEQQQIAEQERQIKELENRLSQQQKMESEVHRKIEQLEFQRMQEQQKNMSQNYNDSDQRYQEQIRLLQQQKDQMQNEMYGMKNDIKQYFESLKDSMNNRSGNQPQGHLQSNSYHSETYNYLQGQQSLGQCSQEQVAMISNVFYNMLNVIGDSERDKRIIGLSDTLKKMVQQANFDDLLAPKAPYVGLGQVNLLRTTDLPLTDQINFIKMGMGEILQDPSAQIPATSFSKNRLSLDIENADPLKASAITFKFMCFKTPQGTLENMPSKLYFQFKFFSFPALITDKVKIKPQNEYELVLRPGHTYYLSKEHPGQYHPLKTTAFLDQTIKNQGYQDTMHDPNLLSISFEVDPSISRIKDENMRLASYLRERFLTVDIFDGDSLFLYGTCKIPLFELMRQGRSTVVRAKECEMCDPDSGEFRGAIQLIMSNQGRMPSITQDEIHRKEYTQSLPRGRDGSPMKSRLQPSQNDVSGKKSYKKIVKSKPMDLTVMQQTNNEVNILTATHLGHANASIISLMNQQQISNVSINNADLRKKLRVDRVRKLTMGHHNTCTAVHSAVEDPSQPDWAKYKSLKEIEIIRETKKDQILSSILDGYCQSIHQISVVPGELEFFTVTLQNPFNQNEVFAVHINDPDDRYLQESELQLVTNPAEWRHWIASGKCKRPLGFDILTPKGDIFLKPNDEVELIFKYMTMREVSQNQNVQASSEIIKQRKIQVIILQSNRQPFITLDLSVVPSSAPIDHIFRFYESQNSHVTLNIPPFIQLNHLGLRAFVSKPNVTVEINKEQQNSFRIETKTEEAPRVTEMTLFIYGDQFRENLLATCLIELHSLVSLYTKIKAGVQIMQSLSLPAEHAREVQIHSNNNKLVYLPKRALNQTFRIIPQTVNHIQVCAKTFQPYQQKIRIHCTDVNSGDLVYQWLMVIDSEGSNVTKKLDVVCKVNHASVQCLEFINKLNQKTVYEFSSSRPDFVVPKIDAITFESKEAKMVDLHFTPQPKYGSAEICIYSNDLEYNVVECYQLKITYLP